MFNDDYLNRTPNKTARGDDPAPSQVVWHETASPNPANPHGTLRYNLDAKIKSSYHFLIAMDGTIFRYVDPHGWIAWHAGVASRAWGVEGWDVNVISVGVEIDGRNNGVQITTAQRNAAVTLLFWLRDNLGIPLDRSRHLEHVEVAPGYKTDARGYQIGDLLALAQRAARLNVTPKPAKRINIPGTDRLYVCGAGFRDFYMEHGGLLAYGYPITDEYGGVDSDGEHVRLMDFENTTFKYKPSLPAPWHIRPVSVAELIQRRGNR